MIDARDARLVAREDAAATFGGRLTFRDGANGGRLTGDLTMTPVEIRLRDRPPPSVVLLPVIEINKPQGKAPPPAPTAPAAKFDVDVDIDMPRRVFVRGRGLDSEWVGALHVGGTAATPTLIGAIHLVRGDFTFAGKRLRLRKGVVSFPGGVVIDPLLDIAAEYQTSELTALIGVAGSVSEPVLVVSSQPPLPESEVLARVMFGKGTARLSPVEAVQLAAALDSLNRGDTFTADAVSSIRQFLGLDVLNVDPGSGAEHGPAAEVGRYLDDPIFVGARRGIGEQTTGGRVEVEILPGLSLQSDILQDVEGTAGSIGLHFKHDY
jgi:translocation and assembly module TamB